MLQAIRYSRRWRENQISLAAQGCWISDKSDERRLKTRYRHRHATTPPAALLIADTRGEGGGGGGGGPAPIRFPIFTTEPSNNVARQRPSV